LASNFIPWTKALCKVQKDKKNGEKFRIAVPYFNTKGASSLFPPPLYDDYADDSDE
jgi:hypothetical protein